MTLGTKTDKSIANSSRFSVFARPAKFGYFGREHLQSFARDCLELYANSGGSPIILDFSLVKVWDIGALLWLSVGLHHYRHQRGLKFLLKLPDAKKWEEGAEPEAFRRSADYLRRWEFNTALENIDADVDALLVPEQRGFFKGGPRKYYLESTIEDESNVLQSLISRRLVQVRNLTDPAFTGSAQISPTRISQCVKDFQTSRIGDILATQCQIAKRDADIFSDHLVTEALMNVLEHPNATIGLVSISVMGNTNELILAVADNGDSMAETILDRFNSDNGDNLKGKRLADLSSAQAASLVDFATKPGISRKPQSGERQFGMGLSYIKEDTVGGFGGRLQILSAG